MIHYVLCIQFLKKSTFLVGNGTKCYLRQFIYLNHIFANFEIQKYPKFLDKVLKVRSLWGREENKREL